MRLCASQKKLQLMKQNSEYLHFFVYFCKLEVFWKEIGINEQ